MKRIHVEISFFLNQSINLSLGQIGRRGLEHMLLSGFSFKFYLYYYYDFTQTKIRVTSLHELKFVWDNKTIDDQQDSAHKQKQKNIM